MQEQVDSPERKVALACFIGAEQAIAELAKGREQAISGIEYWTAIAETVCCAVHLVDRTLLELGPEIRETRMNALIQECITLMPQGMYEFSPLTRAEVDESARTLLLSTYEKRQAEYEALGDDWLNKLLHTYAKHVTELLKLDEPYLALMAAQKNMVALDSTMLQMVPEFFKQ